MTDVQCQEQDKQKEDTIQNNYSNHISIYRKKDRMIFTYNRMNCFSL